MRQRAGGCTPGHAALTISLHCGILYVTMADEQVKAEEVGAQLYEFLRREVVGDGILSMDRLADTLLRCETPLGEQREGEIIIGCMFAAVLAIEELVPAMLRERVRTGLDGEFISHLREQGADDEHVVEWRTILGEHFVDYYRSVEGHIGPALPDALGKEFLWNLTGVEEEALAPVEVVTSYLAAARAISRRFVRELITVIPR